LGRTSGGNLCSWFSLLAEGRLPAEDFTVLQQPHPQSPSQIDLALDDEVLGVLDAKRCGSFPACLFNSATIPSFSFSSSVRNVFIHRSAPGSG